MVSDNLNDTIGWIKSELEAPLVSRIIFIDLKSGYRTVARVAGLARSLTPGRKIKIKRYRAWREGRGGLV